MLKNKIFTKNQKNFSGIKEKYKKYRKKKN